MEERLELHSGGVLRIRGRFLKIATFLDEEDLDQPKPESAIEEIRARSKGRIDIFSYCQRLPDVVPKYPFYHEWESIAVLEFKSHDHWFENILGFKARNKVRKSGKKGVEIRVLDFDDNLVRGIQDIYNEAPIRQGRRFEHYGESFQQVRESNATHLDRSVFIGALFEGKLIGFIKLVYGDRTARAEQIVSKIEHRDKAPTNALLEMAITLSEKRGVPYLVYGIWPKRESLAQFKKSSGFEKIDLPRYYVPLNAKGRIGLRLGLHKEFKERVPRAVRERLFALRENWYNRKFRDKDQKPS